MSVRALTGADLDGIDGLQPPDWAPFRATFERYFTLGCVQPYGIEEDGRLVAMGTLISFARSGWIAQLITHPGLRGRGLGTRMLEFLVAEGGRRGLATLSLVATDQGYPLYAKAGFRVEGEYQFWSRPGGPAPSEPAESRSLYRGLERDRGPVGLLDRLVSGEAREGYWSGCLDSGYAAGPSGAPEGFYLPRAGEGLVAARSPRSGVPLLHRRLDGAARCVVPSENPGPRPVLEQRGFRFDHGARRMVLGPALARHPEWLWSRIGGNLG